MPRGIRNLFFDVLPEENAREFVTANDRTAARIFVESPVRKRVYKDNVSPVDVFAATAINYRHFTSVDITRGLYHRPGCFLDCGDRKLNYIHAKHAVYQSICSIALSKITIRMQRMGF